MGKINYKRKIKRDKFPEGYSLYKAFFGRRGEDLKLEEGFPDPSVLLCFVLVSELTFRAPVCV